jgi:AcrR family transcriptional regulator
MSKTEGSRGDGAQSPRPRGRPRSAESGQLILKATYRLVAQKGFHAFGMDDVVKLTGVAKTTIYRRWPSKSALVMSAVLAEIDPFLAFPPEGSFENRLFGQMRNLAKLFRGKEGKVISSVIGAAQDDLELGDAIKSEYLRPRRDAAYEFFKQAQDNGEFVAASRSDTEAFIDMAYGGLYFRLLLKHADCRFEDLEPWIKLVFQGVSSANNRIET